MEFNLSLELSVWGKSIVVVILVFLSSCSNEVKFGALSREPDKESINTAKPNDNQSEGQDEALEDEEGEGKPETNEEKNEEDRRDREEDETREAEVQEEREGSVHDNNNEDLNEGQESRVTKHAIVSAFLQVSEPALVSSHHDGYLRFWNLSVSLFAPALNSKYQWFSFGKMEKSEMTIQTVVSSCSSLKVALHVCRCSANFLRRCFWFAEISQCPRKKMRRPSYILHWGKQNTY